MESCLFCSKTCEFDCTINDLLKKFFTFLGRHLSKNDTELNKSWSSLSEKAACEGCLKTVKYFCDLYHDLKTIQLLLNWQLSVLNDKVRDAYQREQCAVTDEGKSLLEGFNGDKSHADKFVEFRRHFVAKCTEKLRNAPPKVILEEIVQSNLKVSQNNVSLEPEYAPSPSPSSPLPSIEIPLQTEELDSSSPLLEPQSLPLSESTEDISKTKEENIKLEPGKNQDFPSIIQPNEELAVRNPVATEANELLDFFPAIPKKKTFKKCNNCSKIFTNFKGLSSHQLSCSDQNLKNEDNALESGGEKEDLDGYGKRKSKARGTKRKYTRKKCSFCKLSFTKFEGLRKHVAKYHPEKWVESLLKEKIKRSLQRFKCPHCEEIFAKVHSLQLHWREAHMQKMEENPTLSVDILTIPDNLESAAVSGNCKTTLAKLVAAKSKKFARVEIPLLKPEAKIIICETCQRPFYSEEDFQTHLKLHGSFTCVHCPVTKDFLPDLSSHEVRVHAKVENNIVKCQRCVETFPDFISYLRHHIPSHFSLQFNEKSCPICGNYIQFYELKGKLTDFYLHFKSAHNLDFQGNGKTKHRGLVRCEIDDCSAYFMTIHWLTHHRKVEHQLDKEELMKFQKSRETNICEKCGKAFSSFEKLKRHRIHHAGPDSWQFCCEICSRKCPTVAKLREHLTTHKNERPFVCEICGAKYAQRHNLRIHVNNKHGDVIQDLPRKYDKRNLTSRKGVKRNKPEVDKEGDKRKRN